MEDLTKHLTVSEVVKKIGLTEERVRELINLKQIRATKIGRWRIKAESLQKFIESRKNI